ncbi:MAG: hypothetical protein L0I24_03035 [Pseudonocardia sp.]|nr:hypothetical protein [Pseudonocardia sp.]
MAVVVHQVGVRPVSASSRSGPQGEVPVCPADLAYRATGADPVWSIRRYPS